MTTTLNGARRSAPTLVGTAMEPRPPDPEVPEKPRRRRFTAEYKLHLLEQADACTQPGEIGALLRREGLYSSHLVDWRRQRELGLLGRRRPGRKPRHPLESENETLRTENERLRLRLEQAEAVIEVQKKLSRLFGIGPETTGSEGR